MRCINKKELDIMNQFRLLWEQHSAWTRMAITSIVFLLPDEPETVGRLLRNPLDFGRTFEKYYGVEIAFKFTTLLTEHLSLAADLIKAIMAGDNARAAEINKRWYENAIEISELLDSINPFWTFEEWREMYFMHLELVANEALTMLNGDYRESVMIYDELELQALVMADTMSHGIIRQFPRKFR